MDKLTIAHQERRKALTEAALKKKNAVPVDPQWACHALNEAIPDDAMIVYELITHRVLVDRYLERRHAGESMRSFGGLGQGIPNALGVKTANPDRLVVSILGDGAFNYNPVLACFGLSQEYKMPILTVILNNGAYQSQQNTLERMYPGGFGKEHGKSIATGISPQPDYPKLIEAFGGWGRTVDEPDEIVPAVHEALEEVRNGRAALLNIMLAE
jgi:acetolactate synthase-1/2/3 large subunit